MSDVARRLAADASTGASIGAGTGTGPGTAAVMDSDRTDLRLVPAALAGWIVGWVAPLLPSEDATTVQLVLAVGAVTAGVGALVSRRVMTATPARKTTADSPRALRHAPRDGWLWSTAAASLIAAAVLTVAQLNAARALSGAVDELAAARAVVTAQVRISGDSRAVRPVGGPPSAQPMWIVAGVVETISGRGHESVASAPVAVLGTDPGWDSLTPSTVVQVTGRLSPDDRVSREVAVLRATTAPDIVAPPSALQRAAQSVRAGLRTAVADLPPDARGLLPGIVVGDESLMPPDLIADAKTTGLTHLTAVSGANVAIVLGVVLGAARWSGLRAWAVPAAGALGLAGFVVLARPDPSVLRASVMGLVVLLGLAAGARRRRLSGLGAAVVILLLIDPWLARSYGFALSVLASGAIVLLVPGWTDSWSRVMPRPLATAFAVPVAAQLVCGPVVVMLSDQVSTVGVVANLLAAPAVMPATVLGVIVAVSAVVAPPLAAVLAHVAGIPVSWIAVVARWFADRPYAAVDWPSGVSGALALAALTVVAVVLTPSLTRRPHLLVALVLVPAVALWGVRAAAPGWPAPDWRVVACDVGQGDALVVPIAPGSAVVVDTGPEPEGVDSCLRRLHVSHVPLLVLTHGHIDHTGGILGVLSGRAVDSIGTRPGGSLGLPTDELAAAIERAGARVQSLAAGWTATVGGVRLDVLWPPADPLDLAGLDPTESAENNASLVLRVTDPSGVRSLLTGDVEPGAQRALLRSGVDLSADVLKVPHHGSRHQEAGFIAAVGARVALVSVGADNDYGHPSAVTIDVLEAAGMQVFRTDVDGTIAVAGTLQRLRVTVTADRARVDVAASGLRGATRSIAPQDAGVTAKRADSSELVRVGAPWDAVARWRARSPPATPIRPTARVSC